MSNKTRIDALPSETAALQRMVLALQDAVKSMEDAKAQRAAAEEELLAAPSADFALEAMESKAALEGLADGAEDYTDPRTRARITRAAISLMDRMLVALQKQ